MKLRPMLRRTGWVLGTAVDTLGMAAGVFGLGAVARLRLWRPQPAGLAAAGLVGGRRVLEHLPAHPPAGPPLTRPQEKAPAPRGFFAAKIFFDSLLTKNIFSDTMEL